MKASPVLPDSLLVVFFRVDGGKWNQDRVETSQELANKRAQFVIKYSTGAGVVEAVVVRYKTAGVQGAHITGQLTMVWPDAPGDSTKDINE